MLVSVAIFTLGSGISGAAKNASTLIAGRAVQGLGSGGLNMLVDLIVCDLVPLKERGRFIGIINVFFAIGLVIGPFIGGMLVQHSSWRWVFYIQLPIGGASLLALFLFLHVKFVKAPFMDRIKRIDHVGNIFIVGSSTAILFAFTYAGVEYKWSDARVLVPLIIGFVTMAVFHWYEASRFCKNPNVPPRLFANR